MITVVGSVNVDLVARVPRLPAAGETLTASGLTRVPGGKGANQALAARRLGADVRLVAAVGAEDDPGGPDGPGGPGLGGGALALLRDAGVRLDRLHVTDAAPTGTAFIQVDDAGDTTIVVVPGANATLTVTPADVAGADAVLAVLEAPMAAVEAAVSALPPTTFFALNAAPAQPVPAAVLRRADLVVVNEAEHAAIEGVEVARRLAITHGADGAELVRRDDDGAVVGVARASSPRVDAVDGTAAGDAFAAALVVALLRGDTDADALRFACAVGALTVTRHGAQPSLPTLAEVAAFHRT